MRCPAAKRLAQCPPPALRAPARQGRHERSHCVSCAALLVKATYPIPETEKEPSTINPPEEWSRPRPSERPDIFPDLEKLETPLPHKMPGDPELPEDEEWEEKEKKKPDNDPDKKPTEVPDKDKKKKKKKKDEEKEGEEDDSDKEGGDDDIPETEE